MIIFNINFRLTIKQRHPETIHKLEFFRRLDEKYWWDPLPQIGSTILIPFVAKDDQTPILGIVPTVHKMPCQVTDIIHELNGNFYYSKTTICCEATCDLSYIMEKHSTRSIADFVILLEDRGWSILEHVEGYS